MISLYFICPHDKRCFFSIHTLLAIFSSCLSDWDWLRNSAIFSSACFSFSWVIFRLASSVCCKIKKGTLNWEKKKHHHIVQGRDRQVQMSPSLCSHSIWILCLRSGHMWAVVLTCTCSTIILRICVVYSARQ